MAGTSPIALWCAALVPLLVAGCQSNVQRDEVVRELRMQEDQLYAMEDYLAQYQQLVCKYRTENAALRRQLADGAGPATSAPRARNGLPPTTNGPAIEVPEMPRTNGTRPQQEIEMPEIPPLEETTSADPDASAAFDDGVTLAAGETPASKSTNATSDADEAMHDEAIVRDVRLHSEVVENDAGGGPRLTVTVEPLDDAARATQFDGALSLMLIAPDSDGDQQSLARWDYGPEDVRSAAGTAIGEPAMQFHLELPPDTPVAEPYELWVRLLPRHGGKLLTHVDIDLLEPAAASFLAGEADASNPQEQQMVVAADFRETTTSPPPMESAGVYDGGWTIARPGEPAGSLQGADESDDQWRASLEQAPPVVASSATARPKPRVSRPSAPSDEEEAEEAEAVAADIPKPVAWSPDRPNDSSDRSSRTASTPARPRWSATR